MAGIFARRGYCCILAGLGLEAVFNKSCNYQLALFLSRIFAKLTHDSYVKLTQNTPRGGNTSCVPQLYIYIISKIFEKIKLETRAKEREIPI